MDLSMLFNTPTIEPLWSGPFRLRRRRGGRGRCRRQHDPTARAERTPARPTWEASVAHTVAQPSETKLVGRLDRMAIFTTGEVWRSTVALQNVPVPSSASRSIPALMDLHVTRPVNRAHCRDVATSPIRTLSSTREVATSPIHWYDSLVPHNSSSTTTADVVCQAPDELAVG